LAHPDAGVPAVIVDVAYGMVNGFPVAGVIVHADTAACYGESGSTFGGNHLACAAATAVLDITRDEELIERAATIGSILQDELAQLPTVKEVRGKGLMIGIEFDFPIKELRSKLITKQIGRASCREGE